MVHLPIHLAREAILGGPVQYRWMYPIERYLYTLKRYVSNKAFPEGSIRRQTHQGLSLFSKNCHPLGKGEYGYIDDKAWEQARIYVLKNCDEVLPFLTEHKEQMERESLRNVVKRHEEKFPKWFEERVTQLYNQGNARVNKQLLDLARDGYREPSSQTKFLKTRWSLDIFIRIEAAVYSIASPSDETTMLVIFLIPMLKKYA
ncbi:hypothetical protein AAC387_Pa03g2094 [Persea americana]